MKLSQKTNYALQVLLDLSNYYLSGRVHISDLAQRQRFPPKYLERVLLELKKGGFISSKMGPQGGYTLARAPEKIVLGDVLRWMEPAQFRLDQKNSKGEPDAGTRDVFFGVMAEIDAAVEKVIDGITFAEIHKQQAEVLTNTSSGYTYSI